MAVAAAVAGAAAPPRALPFRAPTAPPLSDAARAAILTGLRALNFVATPDDVAAEEAAYERRTTAVLDAVAAAGAALRAEIERDPFKRFSVAELDAAFDAILAPLIGNERADGPLNTCCFLANVASSKEVRDAAEAANKARDAFKTAAAMRVDVFAAVAAFDAATCLVASHDGPLLDAECTRWLQRELRRGRRMALDRDADTRAALEATINRITTASTDFCAALREDNPTLVFDAAALAGVPPSALAVLTALPPDDAAARAAAVAAAKNAAEAAAYAPDALLYVVNVSAPPQVMAVGQYCTQPSTRLAVFAAFNRRCMAENTPRLAALAADRATRAAAVGYATFADFTLADNRMARNLPRVRAFLDDMVARTRGALAADVADLTAAKAAAEGPAAPPLGAHDYRYYHEALLRARGAVDHEALRVYFPRARVEARVMALYQHLFGLHFHDITADVRAWHADVRAYAVTNAADGAPLGAFLLDLHPRDGKFKHMAVWPLVFGAEDGAVTPRGGGGGDGAGARILPVAAMVCNFRAGTALAPSQLSHGEVVTFLHEFGHVMHNLCARTRLAAFANTRMEKDFTEAPSQMLEHWAWNVDVLDFLTDGELPRAQADALLASRTLHAAYVVTHGLALAQLDLALHSVRAGEAVPDSAALCATLWADTQCAPMPPDTNLAARFEHLAAGYEATYYGYLWSEVLAADMYMEVFGDAPFSAAAGARYRHEVLTPSGARDADDSLRALLGRAPTYDAFLINMGLA